MKEVKTYRELCKITLSFFSAFSAATGYILAGSSATEGLAMTFAGVFMLACGCCALNQYQERHTDALMERTKGRPIPDGRIRASRALLFSLVLIASGLLILMLTAGIPVFFTGLCAVVLYNGLYTYLKRRTAFASVPGAVIGALPPAMGWLAAGGSITDMRILAVCFLFYMWQITHFWLLFLTHGKDYEKAGFPSLTKVFGPHQLERIVFVWILSTTVCSLLIPLHGLLSAGAISFLLVPLSAWPVFMGARLVKGHGRIVTYRGAFAGMNIYILLVMLLLSLDKIKYITVHIV